MPEAVASVSEVAPRLLQSGENGFPYGTECGRAHLKREDQPHLPLVTGMEPRTALNFCVNADQNDLSLCLRCANAAGEWFNVRLRRRHDQRCAIPQAGRGANRSSLKGSPGPLYTNPTSRTQGGREN